MGRTLGHRICAMAACMPLLLLFLPGPVGAQSRGHLGVFIQNASRSLESSGTPVRKGVVVLGLIRNSPAEQGGIQRGDVIVRINGQPVRRVEDLQRLISEAPLGDTAEIEIVRRDQALMIPVKIEPIPVDKPDTGPPDMVSSLLQRGEIMWIFLAGAALSLIVIYLSSVVPSQRRRLSRMGIIWRIRVPRHKLIFASIGLMAVTVLWSSLVLIEAGSHGVVFHLGEGVKGGTLGEGIHFLLPVLNHLTVYDVRSRVYHVRSLSQPPQRSQAQPQDHILWTPTADGLKVGLDLSVRYRLDPARLPELHRRVGPQFEDNVVHPIVWNVTRLVASEYSLLDVYGKQRNEIQRQAFDRVKALFARDGLICEALLLRDVVFTKDFEKTVVAKMIAEQRVQETTFEVDQAGLRAQVHVIEAQGEAQALDLVNRAIGDQPLLLQYLWIKSLPEKVKIMVVPNHPGKSTPWIKPAPSKSPRANYMPRGGE